jgi:succinyl-CoA synthetase alpha subunit
MARAERIIRNLYRDSVALMQLSAKLGARAGVRQASAIMATAGNLALLREAGLAIAQVEAGPNDLLIVLEGEERALEAALDAAEADLTRAPAPAREGGLRRTPPRSLAMALPELPTANLALISTPGDYAAAEAMKALRLGLNVMLFSDNVALADEIALKRYARAHDLLVMGPDCGTAIIGGVPLGFANLVRRGDIGAIAASGTGLQQVTCLIDRWGRGISHAIGTGGHDLHSEVGGITMLQGLDALAADAATRVIVLISKPPHPEVAERVLDAASRAGKPIVVNFLGADPDMVRRANVHPVRTLEDAARLAVALADGGANGEKGGAPSESTLPVPPLAPGQKYIRGLYSGGTFCYEALLLLSEAFGGVASNTPLAAERMLVDVWRSEGHTVIDLGDDAFTRGRPHPMIDQTLRKERILQEAADPEVAVLLFDVVLGYGAHPNPAPDLAATLAHARALAAAAGRQLALVGSVCGTAGDPQDLARQEAVLREAGVLLAESNAQAVRLAAAIAARQARGRGR